MQSTVAVVIVIVAVVGFGLFLMLRAESVRACNFKDTKKNTILCSRNVAPAIRNSTRPFLSSPFTSEKGNARFSGKGDYKDEFDV